MKNYSYIDLFSGAGGVTIGFSDQDFELLLANDIEKSALDTLKHNLSITHPDIDLNRVVLGDIKELYELLELSPVEYEYEGYKTIKTNKEVDLKSKTSDVKEHLGVDNLLRDIDMVDVLVGGPPCQGFSMIGRSKKATIEERVVGFIDDPRNQLFKYFLKFAEKYNPKLVLIENVKGLNSALKYRDLIESSLSNTGSGYNVFSKIINVRDFGIPQNRERIFFIGVRNDLAQSVTGDEIFKKLDAYKVESPINVQMAIGDLPSLIANPKRNNYDEKTEVNYGESNCFGMNISNKSYKELVGERNEYVKGINFIKNREMLPNYLFNHKTRFQNKNDLFIFENLVAGKYLNDKENSKALSKVKYGVVKENGKKKVKSFSDKYFKLDFSKPSKTILAHLETDGNSYVHPVNPPRSLTPREAARIQSFPDWYFFKGTTRNQFKQIGNAVPPMMAKIFAKEFKKVLNNL
ncbi:DNA cytosine methyltransferase [uncultured Algibacter sp.]|uniref:DNA cytosine methyltransferase n=1 Tax=uncultured Algibacter sp. TaxID=298659 RepID=UPI0030ED589E|tara:strand:+ start:1669 stop:3057 length:1389 start_codon:yes stop_codon:yes gene_type:complete